ncbi:MAG TPA: TIGR03086 family metal-binding protein, partial [Acidimicrobiales bacterium]|nr:TIGR03086 family metal-binding protein [Acidimicrobiales bacterium]
VTGLEDERWAGAFSGAAASALEAWEAPGSMEGEIELPFGSFPAPVVAKIYVVEQTTHAWDLATALQAEDALDAELATEVLPIAAEIILPEYRGEEPMPFGAIVPLPSKSPDYDRLAAFMGRRPPAA